MSREVHGEDAKMQVDLSVSKKQRRRRQASLAKGLLTEYAKNCSIQGPKYIAESVHIVERLFWIITFVMSIGMSLYLISNSWHKWRTSPIIIDFSAKPVPVADVPVPSITICPERKVKATVYNFSSNYNKYKEYVNTKNKSILDDVDLDKLGDIASVCGERVTVGDLANSTRVANIFAVAPTLKDTFVKCLWHGMAFNCESYFKAVLTERGVCYNFNGLAENEILWTDNLQRDYKYLNTSKPSMGWTVEDGYTGGYTNLVDDRTYPLRALKNHQAPILSLILRELPKDRDKRCRAAKSGYTIFLQHPSDLPQTNLYYYSAFNNETTSLALKFKKTNVDEGLRGYDAKIRQCYFPEERKLKYFRIYTPDNCLLECLSIFLFERCACVPFHMPHNDSRQICASPSRHNCTSEASDDFTLAESEIDNDVESSQCLPLCASVQYEADILRQKYNPNKLNQSYRYVYAHVEFFFSASHFMSIHRSELFGVTDFLSQCGGLLGLFLGFSFLSLIEIVYFSTIRLYTILRSDLKQEKANQNEKH